MEMSDALPNTYNEGYIHQFQPEPIHEINDQQQKQSLKTSSHEHLSNDHKNCPNQHENSHKLCDETGHPVMNLMESQRKLIRISQRRESHSRTNTKVRKNK